MSLEDRLPQPWFVTVYAHEDDDDVDVSSNLDNDDDILALLGRALVVVACRGMDYDEEPTEGGLGPIVRRMGDGFRRGEP